MSVRDGEMDGSKRTGYSRTQDSKNQEDVRAPPVKWEGVVKWVPPCFPGTPGRSPGWGPAFTDACLSSLVFPIHTSCFTAILHLSLDSVSPGAILSICVFSATGPPPSTSGSDPSLPFGVSVSLCTSLYWHSVLFPCPRVSLGSFPHLSLVLGSPLGLTFPPHIPVCLSSLMLASTPPSISVPGPATPSHFPFILDLPLPI